MVTLRFYKGSDYKVLKELLVEMNMYDEVWEARESLKRKITKDPDSILIAEQENKIIGCVFILEQGLNAFIWRLCVKEKFQKKGIGSLLMQKVDKILKEKGVKEIGFFVDPEKESLHNWYKKRGFKDGKNWDYMYKAISPNI